MKTKNLLMLLLLAALWGPSFLLIKVAVAEIPPITLIVGRVGLAAILLYAILRLGGGNLPRPGRIWLPLAVVALFQTTLPFVLLSWAEQYVDSVLAAILNGLTPLFTILLAHLLTTDDKLTPAKATGVALGLIGVLFFVAPSMQSGLQASTWGILALIVMAASYGFALVYARKHLNHLPSIVTPTGQMVLSTLFLLPLAMVIDQPFNQPTPSRQAIGAVVALAVFGTALAFIVYYRLLKSAPASYVSMVTYLVPVIGILLGVVILGERLAWTDYAGFGLILLGILIVNGAFRSLRLPRFRKQSTRPSGQRASK
ncbi:MAG TPA: EamA family transporter [Anaerolineae bacterium]|jgi:drug/metabolite transporter (DMT)-like permease|nr:EamA family transporter [Anaerolineae bacterium]